MKSQKISVQKPFFYKGSISLDIFCQQFLNFLRPMFMNITENINSSDSLRVTTYLTFHSP